MKKYFTLFFIVIIVQFVNAQKANYKRAKIWFDGKPIAELSRMGIDIGEGEMRKGVWFISDFSEKEITGMQHAGFRTEIIIDDVKSFYQNRNKSLLRNAEPTTVQSSSASCSASAPRYPVSHFHLGSMGGFFTYTELQSILDSMALLYPNLITSKAPIDATLSIEGRPIYYLKISDNPDTDETEPEVMYSAVHHAREPESLSQLIYYMWYLLENYATDNEVRALVDNTEMYFVPCLNPDGYIYNEFTDPDGGGMWRKNRRDNLDGEFGVDLNRNYEYQWGFDDNGSSPMTDGETYRGTGPFSEPETFAMKNFCNSRHFLLALNYHTYGNHHIVPWGYVPDYYTPDSAQLMFYGGAITRYNNYHVGTPSQTVGYVANGSSDDWMYGEQSSKEKIFAMTPEVGLGSDGFWPDTNRIVFLSENNVYANLTLAKLAGRYGTTEHNEPHYLSQLNNEFVFTFRQLGLDTTGTYIISLVPVSANIIAVGAPVSFSNLSVLMSVTDSVLVSLNSSIAPGDLIRYAVSIDNGLYIETDTITQIFGIPATIFIDDCTNTANWNTTNSGWDLTTEDYVSPSSSITDSPYNYYRSDDTNKVTLASTVSLTGAVDARLTYFAKWNIESGYDWVQVLASADNGNTWIPLCGKYTRTGTAAQAMGEPVYDGNQLTWVREEMSLNDFLGQDILLRFVIISDGFQEYDGFYFDDMNIETVSIPDAINQPSASQLFLSPAVPNPSSEKANVNYSNVAAGSSFVLFNTFGQIVFKKTIIDSFGKINIPVKDFSSGMYSYFIQMSDGSVSRALKMIVGK